MDELIGQTSDTELPRRLRDMAFTAGNGERLWSQEAVVDVAEWLASRGFGILGGEIYERHRVGWGTYVREWTTLPDRANSEPWQAYVERGKAQAIAIVSQGDLSGGENQKADRLYFLAFCTEQEFGQVMAIHRTIHGPALDAGLRISRDVRLGSRAGRP